MERSRRVSKAAMGGEEALRIPHSVEHKHTQGSSEVKELFRQTNFGHAPLGNYVWRHSALDR